LALEKWGSDDPVLEPTLVHVGLALSCRSLTVYCRVKSPLCDVDVTGNSISKLVFAILRVAPGRGDAGLDPFGGSLEHSLKCQRLIESRWYRRLWGDRFSLLTDRNRAGHFENNKGGYRMASSVDAKATGYGADVLVADDPHLVKEAESEKVREDVVRWWSETMPSRLNNRQTGAMIVVMQRVHEGGLSGHILAADMGYVHFCVPMSYVPCQHVNAWVNGKVQTFIGDEADEVDQGDIFWMDRRTEEGQLLWPGRFPASEVYKLEKELGPYAYAGQYQQTPAPRGGGILREEWWRPWDKATAEKNGCVPEKYPGFEYILAALDTAYTEKEENDPSALSLWGI
jgi:hypothetical protein